MSTLYAALAVREFVADYLDGSIEGAPVSTSYRIEYAIQRRQPGEEDFSEIGFGSSGEWSSVDAAAHMVESDIQCREWETYKHQPDPDEAA